MRGDREETERSLAFNKKKRDKEIYHAITFFRLNILIKQVILARMAAELAIQVFQSLIIVLDCSQNLLRY